MFRAPRKQTSGETYEENREETDEAMREQGQIVDNPESRN